MEKASSVAAMKSSENEKEHFIATVSNARIALLKCKVVLSHNGNERAGPHGRGVIKHGSQ